MIYKIYLKSFPLGHKLYYGTFGFNNDFSGLSQSMK
ncbi:hypothetical protein BH24BAC1_BH24BAC1_39940 [soil metagenome]